MTAVGFCSMGEADAGCWLVWRLWRRASLMQDTKADACRNETSDATHLAEFHQVEGVVADYNITLGNLIGELSTLSPIRACSARNTVFTLRKAGTAADLVQLSWKNFSAKRETQNCVSSRPTTLTPRYVSALVLTDRFGRARLTSLAKYGGVLVA